MSHTGCPHPLFKIQDSLNSGIFFHVSSKEDINYYQYFDENTVIYSVIIMSFN